LRCEAVRWWLLRAGDAAGALDAARLATMPRPTLPAGTRPGQGSYPALGARYGVEGQTRVSVTVDVNGKVVDSHVVERRFVVPGLGGQRPIAFEAEFDAMSLERARAIRWERSSDSGPRSLELQWKLD
jgi:hypothetical protein